MPARDPGVPLAHYRRHPGCRVRIICEACGDSRDLALEAVIAGLQARGLGDARTGVRALADRLGPCRRCGRRRWETRPAFAPGVKLDR